MELRFDDAAAEVRIFGNSSALQQVVLNMVSNAIRHSPPGGEIRISVRVARREQGAFAVIEFSDSGCGIAAEHIEHIFRAGFSVSGGTSGLGLAVCAQIVKQHDGEIRVQSTPGAGTTFYVEIPTL
jgi:two-component system sensor histidine kinase FlrB